ncbi:MAG: M23 family metallopeptidase [Rhodospirillales bacterium]|nr:M23 family metallopeptidase [Rhodospirillales bacterium]
MIETAHPRARPRRRPAVTVVHAVATAVVITGCVVLLRGDMADLPPWSMDPHLRHAVASGDASELAAALDAALRQLDAARDSGDRARHERDRLRHELVTIEQRLRRLRNATGSTSGSGRVVEAEIEVDERGDMPIADAGARGQDRIGRIASILADLEARFFALELSRQRIVQRIQSGALIQVGALEEAIAQTGLDVEALLSAAADGMAGLGASAEERGRGGPFIADRGRLMGDGADSDTAYARLDAKLRHWEALRSLIRQLPLAAPLDSYAINSEFGRRRDPVNGRRAIHQGVDLTAPRKSPVLAPAPGTVVFAGWNGGYGRFVEIDHGFGLTTAYAHLDRIAVETGRKVALGEKVGSLGNSGRSTGAHLHYEVRHRGEPMDPMAFIRAGRTVLQEQAAAAMDGRFGLPIRRPASPQ